MRNQIKDNLGKAFNVFHRSVFTATKGRLMGNLIGMPVVLLETTGRKSGKKRQSMLTSPHQEGDKTILVASWGGDDRHPLWYLNLKANPEVNVTMGGHKRKMHARPATTEERADLWPKVTSKFKNYAGYQTKTSREIPLVIIEP
jgi:deazaflavin-dependent oxidoreductase (nitroreductase family)